MIYLEFKSAPTSECSPHQKYEISEILLTLVFAPWILTEIVSELEEQAAGDSVWMTFYQQ